MEIKIPEFNFHIGQKWGLVFFPYIRDEYEGKRNFQFVLFLPQKFLYLSVKFNAAIYFRFMTNSMCQWLQKAILLFEFFFQKPTDGSDQLQSVSFEIQIILWGYYLRNCKRVLYWLNLRNFPRSHKNFFIFSLYILQPEKRNFLWCDRRKFRYIYQ